jgi:hypothetical protein
MRINKLNRSTFNLPKNWVKVLLLGVLSAIFLAACATTTGLGFAPTQPATPTLSNNQASAVQAAKSMLAGQLKIDVNAIQLVDIQAVQWPDSCLGVSQVGIMCAMHVVDGYRINLTANSLTYEAHSNLDGSQIVFLPLATPGP